MEGAPYFHLHMWDDWVLHAKHGADGRTYWWATLPTLQKPTVQLRTTKPPPHSGPSSSCPNFRLDTSHSVLPMLCNKEQIALVDSEFPISGGV